MGTQWPEEMSLRKTEGCLKRIGSALHLFISKQGRNGEDKSKFLKPLGSSGRLCEPLRSCAQRVRVRPEQSQGNNFREVLAPPVMVHERCKDVKLPLK